MRTQNTAVIYFSRLPGEETHFKTFSSANKRLNKFVSGKLYEQTKAELIKTGLPVFYYSEENQKGDSFGEKISNACKDIFALGFHSLIIAGSDTPSLNAGHIQKAADGLLSHDYVSGQTQIGGCYLFGVNKDSFCEQKIKNLQWQSVHLQESIKTEFQDIFMLGMLQEINTEQQLKQFLYFNRNISESLFAFINIIKSWLRNSYNIFSSPQAHSNLFLSTAFGRAP